MVRVSRSPDIHRTTPLVPLSLAAMSMWALLAMTFPPSAAAHHSFVAIYDAARYIDLEGIVSEFQFVNPHPMLVLSVTRPGSPAESWRAEMDNRFELADIGMTAQTFRPGDRVRVRGNPGRDVPRVLYLRALERPSDGLRYEQVGSTPRIQRPERR